MLPIYSIKLRVLENSLKPKVINLWGKIPSTRRYRVRAKYVTHIHLNKKNKLSQPFKPYVKLRFLCVSSYRFYTHADEFNCYPYQKLTPHSCDLLPKWNIFVSIHFIAIFSLLKLVMQTCCCGVNNTLSVHIPHMYNWLHISTWLLQSSTVLLNRFLLRRRRQYRIGL